MFQSQKNNVNLSEHNGGHQPLCSVNYLKLATLADRYELITLTSKMGDNPVPYN